MIVHIYKATNISKGHRIQTPLFKMIVSETQGVGRKAVSQDLATFALYIFIMSIPFTACLTCVIRKRPKSNTFTVVYDIS